MRETMTRRMTELEIEAELKPQKRSIIILTACTWLAFVSHDCFNNHAILYRVDDKYFGFACALGLITWVQEKLIESYTIKPLVSGSLVPWLFCLTLASALVEQNYMNAAFSLIVSAAWYRVYKSISEDLYRMMSRDEEFIARNLIRQWQIKMALVLVLPLLSQLTRL